MAQDQGVGREVKRLREERGWSQAKLAVEAEMSVSGVSMIENGQRNLTTTTLAKLAKAFGLEVPDLFPKAQALLPLEEAAGREEASRYLRAWRAFVYKLILRWEKEPPASAREVSVVLDTMQVLASEGAFERPAEEITTGDGRAASEWLDLQFLFRGLERLNRMADEVQADEEAEKRRSTFRVIEERLSAKSA